MVTCHFWLLLRLCDSCFLLLVLPSPSSRRLFLLPLIKCQNKKAARATESWLTFTRLSLPPPPVCLSICLVSWTKRRWPGRNPGPARGSLCLSVCQRLGSGSRPGFGSGPGPACLIGAPGGEKRGHPPTSWSQKQKVLFLRLILRRLNLWAVDLNGICDRRKKKKKKKKKKKEGGKYWNFTIVNLLFIWCIVRDGPKLWWSTWRSKGPLTGEAAKAVLWERFSPSDQDTKKTWRTEADHVKDYCTFLKGREGMSNIIKRRQDWQ